MQVSWTRSVFGKYAVDLFFVLKIYFLALVDEVLEKFYWLVDGILKMGRCPSDSNNYGFKR